MKQIFFDFKMNTNGQKLYEFTDQTIDWVKKNNFNNGILNLNIQHTSASLMNQDNPVLSRLHHLLHELN